MMLTIKVALIGFNQWKLPALPNPCMYWNAVLRPAATWGESGGIRNIWGLKDPKYQILTRSCKSLRHDGGLKVRNTLFNSELNIDQKFLVFHKIEENNTVGWWNCPEIFESLNTAHQERNPNHRGGILVGCCLYLKNLISSLPAASADVVVGVTQNIYLTGSLSACWSSFCTTTKCPAVAYTKHAKTYYSA